jgi:hypothetical protein
MRPTNFVALAIDQVRFCFNDVVWLMVEPARGNSWRNRRLSLLKSCWCRTCHRATSIAVFTFELVVLLAWYKLEVRQSGIRSPHFLTIIRCGSVWWPVSRVSMLT